MAWEDAVRVEERHTCLKHVRAPNEAHGPSANKRLLALPSLDQSPVREHPLESRLQNGAELVELVNRFVGVFSSLSRGRVVLWRLRRRCEVDDVW